MATISNQVADFYTVRRILRDADNYENLVELCEAHRLSVREVEGAILLYEMEYPDFLTSLELRVSKTYEEYKEAKMSQPEMASLYGTTVVNLRIILTKLGFIKSRKEKRDEIENLKHLIKTRGLKVSQALDLSPYCRLTTPQATNLLLASGFDCYAYATVQACDLWRKYQAVGTLPMTRSQSWTATVRVNHMAFSLCSKL